MLREVSNGLRLGPKSGLSQVLTYGQAFAAAAGTLRRHQPELTVEAADLDAAANGLLQAGWACRQLGPNLRGFLPPLPWLAPGRACAAAAIRPDRGRRALRRR